MDRAQRQGMLYVLMAVLGYSFLPTLTKRILAEGLTPLDIALWRFLFAAPLFWLVIRLRHIPAPTVALPRYRLVAMGAMLAVSALGAFSALQFLPASTFIVLFYTYPVIVAVICLFLGERLPTMGWFALGLTLLSR
jgi:drug/metabolite transporter (DMT)-like permease